MIYWFNILFYMNWIESVVNLTGEVGAIKFVIR